MSQACVDVAHPLDREQRAEDLLAQHGRVGGQVARERGRAEPAVARAARCRARRSARPLSASARVAADALLRALLDQRRDRRPEAVGLPDDEHLDRAGEALEQRVGDRLVHEHARRPPSTSGRRRRRPTGRSPARPRRGRRRSRRSRSSCRPSRRRRAGRGAGPRGRRGRRLDDLEPDRARAGEGDRRDARVAHERRAGLAVAGHERERIARHARLVQRPHERGRACRATARPASGPRRSRPRAPPRSCPVGIASGKFQGEITAATPRGAVAHLVALARAAGSAAARPQLDRAARA